MPPTLMRLAAWLVIFSLPIAACQPLPGAVVVSAPGLVVWLDQPPDGAGLPFEPFTLRAHARGGVEAITFLVSAGGPPVSLGSVTTDSAQPLVMAELVWNPSAPGVYAIQAQASNAQGDVFSAFARVCVSDLAAAGGVCAEANAATTPGTTAAPENTPTESPSGPTGTATGTPRLSATPKPTSSSAPASATVTQAVPSATLGPTGTALPPTPTFTLAPPSDTPKPTDTQVPADTAPPAIDKLSAVPNPTAYGNACTKEEAQFTASATVIDTSGVAGVTLFYRYGSGGKVGSWLTAGMGAVGGDQYAVTVTNDANAIYTLLGGADGYVEYYIQAQDALGNAGQSPVPVITLQYCLG